MTKREETPASVRRSRPRAVKYVQITPSRTVPRWAAYAGLAVLAVATAAMVYAALTRW